MSKFRKRTNCRICDAGLPAPFLDLGQQPPANNLLESPTQEEESYALAVAHCGECGLVQLIGVVNPEILFKHYLYVPSTSRVLDQHFASMANALGEFCSSVENPLVVDIGSNEGLLLSHLKANGNQVLGVEPAENLAKSANANGIPTICDFFSPNSVDEILRGYKEPTIVTATNVMAHTDDVQGFVSNASKLVGSDGVLVIEAADVEEMLKQETFDLIYHEHVSFFAMTPLAQLFENYGMEIFRVDHMPVQGGSLRIFVQNTPGKRPVEASVEARLKRESSWYKDLARYVGFADGARSLRDSFTALVKERHAQGKQIAGYGLPAKANTLLNFCGLTSEQISYIVEDNPLKQGMWAPGSHIPIVSADHLGTEPADCVVIFPWNLADEITAKMRDYRPGDVEIILPTQAQFSQGGASD